MKITPEQQEGIKQHYKEFLESCERVNKNWELKKKLKKESKQKKK